MIMKNKKNNLDEMQEQKLLKIEHNAYNIAFWGLLAAILIQSVVFDMGPKATIGETVLMLVISIYTCSACIKEGIWDRKLKADNKTNIITSLIASSVMGGLYFLSSYIRYGKLLGSVATFIFMFITIFVLCIIALTLTKNKYLKRKKEIEDKLDN